MNYDKIMCDMTCISYNVTVATEYKSRIKETKNLTVAMVMNKTIAEVTRHIYVFGQTEKHAIVPNR